MRRRGRLKRSAWACSAVAILSASLGITEASAERGDRGRPTTIFVKAAAGAGGKGTRAAPFNSLRPVERRSRPGARIVVLASARTVPALDGGIALKPRQRLIGAGKPVRRKRLLRRSPRITNTDPERIAGDGVRLARGTLVRNLEIAGTVRGGIYGQNVGRVRIRGNNVSSHNTSCTEGFHIPPFQVPTTVPGVGIPISAGLINGWAGIMVDANRGKRRIAIARNRVHGAECGDGIDVRMSGTARARAAIRGNIVRDLRQGEDFESVLAIGMQTRDDARLAARVIRNLQTNLGNEEDPGVYVLGADAEGIFANLDGGSRMRVKIQRNRFSNPNELGGFSTNGVELVNMGDDGARARMTITDSTFSRTPGDILEILNFGVGGDLGLTLRRVTATRSVGSGNTVVIPGNNGDCLLAGNGAAGGSLTVKVRDSVLTDCANNGITVGGNVVEGSGPAGDFSLDVDRSIVTGNHGSNLLAGAFNDLDTFDIKIQRSDLSDSEGGLGISLANVAFENFGTTTQSRLDLGGGALGSLGRNCIAGGLLAANLLNYDVTAEHNWWGTPGGPGLGRVVALGGTLDSSPALDAAPACGHP